MNTEWAPVPRTKKAARAASLFSETHLTRGTEHRIPRRHAVPIIVKGESFYAEDQLEDLILRTAARREDLVPIVNAKVYSCYNGRQWFDAYRLSDCISVTEEHHDAERADRRTAESRRRAERAASAASAERRRIEHTRCCVAPAVRELCA